MSEINAESTTMPPVELRMPRASEREEMLAGKLYNSVDPELNALREKAGDLCARFNAASRRVPIMPPVPRFSMSCCPATVPALT